MGEIDMYRTVWSTAALLAVLIASVGVARDLQKDIITERILFRSGTSDFDDVYPVTERLNQILSEISRIEIEARRGIPNFVVYPSDSQGNAGQPYALLWADGAYVMSEHLPVNGTTFLIYDPRRLPVADRSVENGQDVEYRHFILNYGFNSRPEKTGIILDSSARLEPTERSLYISREIVGGRESSAERMICFPRLEIPDDIAGEQIKAVSIQIESALHDVPSDARAEGDEGEPTLLARGVDRFFFRVR
jgi:hypothetical protein